jgi:hypothetical protein
MRITIPLIILLIACFSVWARSKAETPRETRALAVARLMTEGRCDKALALALHEDDAKMAIRVLEEWPKWCGQRSKPVKKDRV